MDKPKLAVIVGSNRAESFNRKLAHALVRLIADRVEACFIQIDDLPLYNQDLEGHRPAVVRRFTEQVAGCGTLLLVTPEHNRSLPAVLKNAIDWGSKPADQNVWRGKLALITGTSPGAIGTAVAQQHLRAILGNLGTLVVGGEAYLNWKPELLDAAGNIAIDSTRAFLQSHLDHLLTLAARLA